MKINKILKMPVGQAFRAIFTTSPAPTPSRAEPNAYHTSRSGNGFYGGGQSAGAKSSHGMAFQNRTLSLDHHRLRQGARLAMQDSPQGRAIVETKANAVAYTGLKLEPTPSAEILGITQEEAAAWAKNTSERFNLWANDKNAHRSEVMTFNQFQWLYAFWKERDNDIFTRLYYDNRSKDLQNPLQFESIDPDQVRGGAHTTGYGGFQPTDDGLIKDNRNRTTGFKVQVRELVSSQGGFNQYAYKQVTINKKSRSGRIFMLHGFKPEYAGQMRGFTKLAPILQDLEKATDFSLSHINYAISKSRLMAWVKPSEEEDAKPIMDQSETAFGQAPAADNFKSPSDDATEEEFLGEMKCYSTPENTYGEPVPVFVQNLLRGQDIKFAPDSAAAQQYAQFMESFLGDLSVVSGTPLEAVRMKVSSSFSAGNAMFLLFQRVIEIVRDDQVADCNGPVYEMWMSGEIAAGRITAPGFSDPRLRKAWLKSTWRGIPVPAIDPDKIAKANMKNIEMGTDSAESISQRTSGKSAIDNITSNNATYKDYEPPPFSEAAIAEEAAEGQETEED